MTLAALLARVPAVDVYATGESWKALEIDKLVYDSREAGPSTLFFALSGTHTDGHRYLAEVAACGCRAFVVSQPPDTLPAACREPGSVLLRVESARLALSPFAAAFYGQPSHEIPVIGVTGTDGKSTTVSFIHQLLELAGHPSGFFSTVEWKTGAHIEANKFRQSTPEAPLIHESLRRMVDNGLHYAVLESTSHGLSPLTNRLGDVRYAAAVFTNVTLEHLEFHGTVEQYRRDKARLFAALAAGPKKAFGVINGDDPHAGLFAEAAGDRAVFRYSISDPKAHLFARSLHETAEALDLELVWKGEAATCHLGIPGRVNAENLMAALLTVAGLLSLRGPRENPLVTPLDLLPLVPSLRPLKGRMTPVRAGQSFSVVVDYAHTPGAFEKLLPAVKAVTPGRLIVVFGSGGERDREKRPLQGALADRWADLIVLTDEDPRLEDPQAILSDLEAGITGKTLGASYWKIIPRREALRHAFSLAVAGDTVLLLGKGHEQSLVTATGSHPWDEESVARELLTGDSR
ncbi:MAG: UDP-N-acetylmuramoyl-L-alanyl-D-glutamate--2,6-diaminopimelate ligase [Spirochaetales bacterium]